MKKNSGSSYLSLRGSRAWLPGVLLLLLLYVINRRRIKMTTQNSYGFIVYGLLIDNGFFPQTARFITAQAAHETGNFTSAIFRKNNNCFGMKLPKIRKTLAISERHGHAVYETLADCVGDFWLYYKYVNLPDLWKDAETYITALKNKSYFEDKLDTYIQGVKKFYKLYFGD